MKPSRTAPTPTSTALIAEARALLQPSSVKLGFPRWFCERLQKAFGPRPSGLRWLGLLRRVCDSRGWIDHCGQTVYQGKSAFAASRTV